MLTIRVFILFLWMELKMRMSDKEFNEIISNIKNNTIVELDLFDYFGEDLTDDRIAIISDNLKQNTSVKEIQFSGRGATISNEAAKNIADMLRVNSSVKKLYLHYVKMTDEGARYIEDAVKSNSSLKEVKLPGNIDKNILRGIHETLKNNYEHHLLNKYCIWEKPRIDIESLVDECLVSVEKAIKVLSDRQKVKMIASNPFLIAGLISAYGTNHDFAKIMVQNSDLFGEFFDNDKNNPNQEALIKLLYKTYSENIIEDNIKQP